jgi:thiamine monophosphate synthase
MPMISERERPPGTQIGLLFEWSFEDARAKDCLLALHSAGLSPASLLLPPAAEDNPETPALIHWLQSLEIAVLFRGPIRASRTLGGDGLHLADGDDLIACRKDLGENYILGVGCDLSRDAAMTAGKRGADYVAFGNLEGRPEYPSEVVELVAWWQELMEIPVMALGAGDYDMLADFAAAGADFLHVRPPLWRASEDLIAVLSRIASPQAS